MSVIRIILILMPNLILVSNFISIIILIKLIQSIIMHLIKIITNKQSQVPDIKIETSKIIQLSIDSVIKDLLLYNQIKIISKQVNN
jgi:hypothetical protein